MSELTEKKCAPCEGGSQPFSDEQIKEYLPKVEGWTATEQAPKRIRKPFSFQDFKETIAFVNSIASLAESEGHHPDLHIFYNKLIVELWTHAIGGLSENDFILAAKIDAL